MDQDQLQAYYTLRHALPADIQRHRQKYLEFIRAIEGECSLSVVQDQAHSLRCIEDRLSSMRDLWAETIRATRNSSAIEELGIDIDRKIGLQQILRSGGYLPASSAIDGIFGTATRTAIAHFQQAHHLPGAGFMTEDTARRLFASQQLPPRATQPARAERPANNRSGTSDAFSGFLMLAGTAGVIALVLYGLWAREKSQSRCPSCGQPDVFKRVSTFDEPRAAYDRVVRDSSGQTHHIATEVGVRHVTRHCRSCGHEVTFQSRYECRR